MHVVVLGTGPERQEVVQRPGEFVAAVCVDGLEQAEHNPEVHGQEVQVAGDGTPENRRADGTETEHHDFDRRGVFSGQTEGRRVLVVDLVDVFIEEAVVHGAVDPVVPGILENEEDGNLEGHLIDTRERDGVAEAEELAHGVEEPDLRELDGEVGEEDEEGALPLFPSSRDLILSGSLALYCFQKAMLQLTCWILYRLNQGIMSIIIHGSERPK